MNKLKMRIFTGQILSRKLYYFIDFTYVRQFWYRFEEEKFVDNSPIKYTEQIKINTKILNRLDKIG